MWLICSNRKLYNKKTIFFPPWHNTTISFVIDSLNIFTAQIVHSYMYWAKTHPLADQNVHGLQKMFSTNYHAKATRTVLLDWSFAMGSLKQLHLLTLPWSRRQQRFVWSTTDTLKITTSTSQLIVTSAHCTAIDCKEYLLTILLKWPGFCHSVNVWFLKKRQLRKVSWHRIYCTRNRWWLSPGPYLQVSHAPCSLETACLVFLAQLNFEDNSEFYAT